MKTIQNLHTHSVFSDGKNTINEMIASAFNHGLKSLGFSDHMYTGIPIDMAGMKEQNISVYFSALQEAKKTSPIEIFTGMEFESRLADGTIPKKDGKLDYAIGSIHFFHKGNELHFVDWDTEHFLVAIQAFGGPKSLMENYFEEIIHFAKNSDYDITGHFDLYTKFLDMTDMSFLNTSWYKDMALNAVEEVAKCGKIFELNTGGIARRFRTSPYPQDFILKRIKELKAPIIISADCHNVDFITCYFEEAEEKLKSLGFKSQMMLTQNGFTDVAL